MGKPKRQILKIERSADRDREEPKKLERRKRPHSEIQKSGKAQKRGEQILVKTARIKNQLTTARGGNAKAGAPAQKKSSQKRDHHLLKFRHPEPKGKKFIRRQE